MSDTKIPKQKRDSPEAFAFYAARQRCCNPNHPKFEQYGGRGIEFRFRDFLEFYAELGDRPGSEYSVDRINNDGHYEPGNVRWATRLQQSRNRHTARRIEWRGVSRTVAGWSQVMGLHYNTLHRRLQDGWCKTCALLNPHNTPCEHR